MKNSIIKLSTNPAGFDDSVDQLTAEMFASALPVQHSHDYYSDDDLGIYVGVWDTTDMMEAPGDYELEEFMVLISGQAKIKNNQTDQVDTVQAGESFVIPKGYDCQWHQHGYLKKFYLILDNDKLAASNKAANGIAHFNSTQSSANYANEQQTFYAGVSGATDTITYSQEYRFVYVFQGQVTIANLHGRSQMLAAGDAVFIKPGEVLTCSASADFKHYFANIRI